MRAEAVDWVTQELDREVVVGRRAVAGVAVGATVVCLTLGAYARGPLPFTPVPITLQTFFVLVAGAALGRRLGTLSLSVYLLLGTLGLPIFTGAWLGPTTGYLVGFVAAGWVVGVLSRRLPRHPMAAILPAMVAGTLVIYRCGAAWLAFVVGLGVEKAFVAGVLAFVPGDTVKLLAAAALVRAYHGRLRTLFP